jgi:hypothetical protein
MLWLSLIFSVFLICVFVIIKTLNLLIINGLNPISIFGLTLGVTIIYFIWVFTLTTMAETFINKLINNFVVTYYVLQDKEKQGENNVNADRNSR